MARKKTLAITFLCSLLLATLSIVWLIVNGITNGGLSVTEPLYQFVIIMACSSIVICIFSTNKLLFDIRSRINDVKEKERDIKECYQYDQLLNPPIMNN